MILIRDIIEESVYAYKVRRGDFALVLRPNGAFPMFCAVLNADEIGKWVELILLDPETGLTFSQLRRSLAEVTVRREAPVGN